MTESYEYTSKNENAVVDTTNEKIIKLNRKVNNVDKKLSSTNKKVKSLNESLLTLEQRDDDIDSKLNIIDSRVINIETSLKYNRQEIVDAIDSIKDNIKYSDNYIEELTKVVHILKIWAQISTALLVISIIAIIILFII